MRYFLIYYIIFFWCFQNAQAQLTESMIKSNLAINMIKYVEWEDEGSITKYTLGVLGKDEIVEDFKKVARKTKIKGKDLEVVQFKRINDIKEIHVLFVEERRNNLAEALLEKAFEQNILMFTDSCMNRDAIMINMLDIDMPGNQFEINTINLNKANLSVSTKLLFYGGSQEDLRGMLRATGRELSQVQEDLKKQKAALQKQREELELKKQEIEVLNDEITSQENHLESMTQEIGAKQDSLSQKTILLEKQIMRIQEQQADIENQNDQLLQQKQEIKAGNAFLNEQKREIESQELQISQQQNQIQAQSETLINQTGEIQEQTQKIEKQQTLLYYLLAFVAVFAAMIFFILRAYRIKRHANNALAKKNIAISRQKEEIQRQQEQLKLINQKIEKQNENIKSSIHYALTIQEALLPPIEKVQEFLESFVIYRPRDIVSGDFYWLNEVHTENGSNSKIFVGVADCTGHGVPGAFLSMIGIKLLDSIVNERKQYDPKAILESLNQGVQEALQQEKKVSDDGMDICLCSLENIDKHKFKVIFSGARRPLYFSCDQRIEVLSGDRKTVGGRFYKEQVFTNQEIILSRGDRIYLTSDGIADQNAPNRAKFGSKKLIGLLGDSLHLSMNEQKEFLETALDSFQQDEKQRDDISLMAIKL